MTETGNKLSAILLAALLCLGTGAALMYRYTESRVDQITSERDQAQSDLRDAKYALRATNAALNAKTAALGKLQETYDKKDKDLSDAIKANPQWATGVVPDAVFNSLFDD